MVLFDAAAEPARRRYVIGESIPPAATPLLHRLGILAEIDAGDHLPCAGTQSVWGGPEPGFNDFLFDPVGKGYHLDRRTFDAQLRSAATEAGADVRGGVTFRVAQVDGDGFELTTASSGGDESTHRFDFVVDATGIRGAFARRLGIARNVLDQLFTVCAVIDTPPETTICDHTLLEATEYGWWYAARLPRNRLILSVTTDLETLKADELRNTAAWSTAFARTTLMRSTIGTSLVAGVSDLIVKAAPTMILSAVVGRNWLAVGDAASAYDPISSAGITKALANGIAAADAISAYQEDPQEAHLNNYQRCVFSEFTNHVKLRYRLYAAERRWQRAPFWHRRSLSTPATSREPIGVAFSEASPA